MTFMVLLTKSIVFDVLIRVKVIRVGNDFESTSHEKYVFFCWAASGFINHHLSTNARTISIYIRRKLHRPSGHNEYNKYIHTCKSS